MSNAQYTYEIDMLNGDNDSERQPPKSLGECLEWLLERFKSLTVSEWISVNVQGVDCVQRIVRCLGSEVAHIIRRERMTRYCIRVPDSYAAEFCKKLIEAEDGKLIQIVRSP